MPWSLKRYQESAQSHFLTFSCYQRQPKFQESRLRDLFLKCLDQTRVRFQLLVYGFVVMPEHVHLLVSEPDRDQLALAVQSLKLAVAKRLPAPPFWQKRYYDHNVRSYQSFQDKLDYIHANPVVRGLVQQPGDWRWSSFRHYALGEFGNVEIESEWTAGRRKAALMQEPSSVPEEKPPR